MSAAPPTPRRLTSVLTTPLAWIFLMVTAFTTTTAVYSLPDAAAVGLLYGLLALALVAAARVLGCWGVGGRLAGAALAGLVLAWHWREQTRIEGSGATLWTSEGVLQFLPLVALATGMVLLLEVMRGRGRPQERRRQLLFGALATAAFFVLLGGVFQGTATARWHLIRHNRMIGAVAFHVFGTPVAAIEAQQWEAHRNGAPQGQPQWVLDLYEGTATGNTVAGRAATGSEAIGDTAVAAAAGEGDTAGGASMSRPDIVFIMLDTLRADALAAYRGDDGPAARGGKAPAADGGNGPLMPVLDELAAGATVFTDVLANAPWTQPSVASFFTGAQPEEHGVISYPYRLSANVVTLAEVLRAQGYRTAAFIANAVLANPDSGFVRGFDTFEYIGDPERTYARADTVTDRVTGWLADDRRGERQAAGGSGGSAAPAAAAGDERASPRAAGRAPLFLYVHYFDPHVPYLSSDLSASQQASPTTAAARRYYADELRFLDGQVARLLASLDRPAGGGETAAPPAATAAPPGAAATEPADHDAGPTAPLRPGVLLVSADHGEEFGEHDGLGHSQTLYSEVLRIPALLRLRDAGGAPAAAPARVDARLEGRDFFDLLLRLGGGEPLDVAGWAAARNHVARIASLYFEKDPGRSALVHYLLRPYRARIFDRMIERDGWRYVFSAFGPTDELYDLTADPRELINRAGDESARVRALRAELEATPPYWARRVPLQLSEEALRNLRQLGYVR